MEGVSPEIQANLPMMSNYLLHGAAVFIHLERQQSMEEVTKITRQKNMEGQSQ